MISYTRRLTKRRHYKTCYRSSRHRQIRLRNSHARSAMKTSRLRMRHSSSNPCKRSNRRNRKNSFVRTRICVKRSATWIVTVRSSSSVRPCLRMSWAKSRCIRSRCARWSPHSKGTSTKSNKNVSVTSRKSVNSTRFTPICRGCVKWRLRTMQRSRQISNMRWVSHKRWHKMACRAVTTFTIKLQQRYWIRRLLRCPF